MATLNMVPEFTPEEPMVQEKVQPLEPPTEVEEKETPSEPPAEEKPVLEGEPSQSVDTGELEKQVQGLQTEREKLLGEIRDLRGQRREIKQQELQKVDSKIDELKDIHPEDAALIDKVLRSKGYITRQESHEMFYKAVENDKISQFLNKFPEYKPENDPNDLNWNALIREFQIYRKPDDPHQIGLLLERAHQAIAKPAGGQEIPAKRQQLKTASVGSGGIQRSSSGKTLDEDKRAMLIHGGWSKEEISKIEKNL